MIRKCIVIGIPTFGTVNMRWAMAYGQIQTPMNAITPRLVKWGLEIGEARNSIVADALKMDEKPSHVFFLDDDVIASPYALLQLMQAGVDVVSGVYYSKSEFAEPLIFGELSQGSLPYVPCSGVQQVNGHGMGLTLIRCDVFRRLADELDLGTDARGNPRWFHTGGDVPGEQQETEDLYFCRQCEAIGIERHIDTSPHAFAWHVDARTGTIYPIQQWLEYAKTGQATWEVM